MEPKILILKKDLIAKARGFTIAIQKMHNEQRLKTPNGVYGHDYNMLRELTMQSYPSLKVLLPPAVSIYTGHGTVNTYTNASFGEIDTYCEQICQLLGEQGD